ncbi:hypothetical protein AB0L62_10180 [Nocardia asteroides]|uniref:hypothetical protein n=1 Tax=Nocardia asteroides TaxID=1824 RepID=UPI00344A5F95
MNKRVDTMRVLVGGHASLNASSKLTAITGELRRIVAIERSGRKDAWLIKVLHTTRALDTTLSEVIAAKGWPTATPSLGPYLSALFKNGIITAAQRDSYQKTIVYKRNKYMHEAGAMPTKLEADSILSEMHACLVVILSRV